MGSAQLIFDGDCGFCTTSARWAQRGWADSTASATAWQHLGADGLSRLGLSPAQAAESAWWVDAGGRRYQGHEAIGQALRAGRGWRRIAGRLVLARPLAPLGRLTYRLVARYRHRLPGGTPACRVER